MAVLALTLVGQAAGAAIGGSILGVSAATIGGAIGMAAGNYFFGPKPQDQVGPQLRELDTATAGEGAPIPIMWGSMRVPAHIIWAPKLTQRTRKTKIRGGKGGSNDATSTTFYATGSWAVSFGYNRSGISRVLRRVWANKQLVYDATGSGGAVLKAGLAFTYYDGTQTVADPTMEGIIGVGNVPAYTGQAMLVFEDLNLEAYNNRIPSIEAELIDNGANTTALTDIDLADHNYPNEKANSNGYIWHDAARDLVWASFHGQLFGRYGALFVVNPATKRIVWKRISDDIVATGSGWCWMMSYNSVNDMVAFDNGSTTEVYDTTSFALLGVYGVTLSNLAWPLFQGLMYTATGPTLKYWYGNSATTVTVSVPSGYDSSVSFAPAIKVLATDQYGVRTPLDDEVHTFLNVTASTTKHGYFNLNPPTISGGPTITTVASSGVYEYTTPQDAASGFKLFEGQFKSRGLYVAETASYWFPFTTLADGGWLLEVEPDTGAVIGWYDLTERIDGVSGGNFAWPVADGQPLLEYDEKTRNLWFMGYNAGVVSFSVTAKTGKAYSGATANSAVHYDNTTGNVIGMEWDQDATPGYDRIWFLSINNVDQSGLAVSSVVRDVCLRAGVPSSAVVFTNVSATVTGAISNERIPARGMVNALLQYAYADGYESEYRLKFVGRGAAVATTLSEDYIGAIQPNAQPNQTEATLPHHVELPKALDLRYYNASNDFQIGNALYQWYTSVSERKATLNMPVAITPQQAMDRAALILHATYERTPYKLTFGPRYGALEPTDVITLPLNSRNERVRIERIRRGVNGIREVEALQDSSQAAVSYASAAAHDQRNATIANYGTIQPFWLDTPLLQDADSEHPGPYIAVYNYSSGFQAGALYTSPDNNGYTLVAQFDDEPAYGFARTAPEDITTIGAWDRDNTITVDVIDGAAVFESISSAALFAGGNAAAYGKPGRWEIIQYLSVAVASSGAVQLTSLLRGRRGSDAYVNTHQDSDFFVVLDESSLSRLTYAVADIGNSVYARAVQPGQSYADVTPQVFTVTNRALKPYSPISVLVASASVGSDLAGVWTRRTRAGGSYVGLFDNVGGPVNEDAESWQIDVVNPATGQVLASNAIATTSANFFYSSAAQASDGAATIGTVTFRIFQMSAAVGRGTPASVTYERPWETGVKYAIGIGVDKYLPLGDAGTGTLLDYYGSAVGIWGASTGVTNTGAWLGSIKTAAASINCDSSTSTGILGRWPHDYINGKKTFSIAYWVSPDYSGQDTILNVYSNSSNHGLLAYMNGATVTFLVYPNGGGSGMSNSYGASGNERGNGLFVVHTMNTSTITPKMYVNGQHVDSDTYGSGHSSYANPISWGAYSSVVPGRIGAYGNGVTAPFTGLLSDMQFYPTALSSATVSTLYEKQQGAIQRATELGATHLWTLDQRTSKFYSTEPDRAGALDLTTTFYQSNGSAAVRTVRYGGDFNTTYHARRSIPADMKTQVFTFEGWVKFDTLQTSAPFFAPLPAGANASARGLYVQQTGSTIVTKYGPGDGVWRTLTGPCSAGAMTHWAIAKASAAAPVLFINGSAVAAGASAFDIEWSDATGTPAPPTGTLYINRANFNRTADASVDTAGIDGKMNLVTTYATALSSATIMASYLFGMKQL